MALRNSNNSNSIKSSSAVWDRSLQRRNESGVQQSGAEYEDGGAVGGNDAHTLRKEYPAQQNKLEINSRGQVSQSSNVLTFYNE